MATKRRDFDLAETETATVVAEQFASNFAVESNPFPTVTNKVYRLVDTSKNGRVHLDGCNDTWNPKLGRMDRIWLLTGVQTIWQSELGDILKDKEFIRNNKRTITFEGRILRVPEHDTLMIEFLAACSHNRDNPHNKIPSKTQFYEWNPVAQQKAAMAKEMLGVQMVAKATEQPMEKMKQHAFYLGISLNDEMGFPKTEEGIRLDYMIYANRNPEQFQLSLDSKEVGVKYLVRRAILDAKINIGSGHGRMTWAATGGYICTVPQSMEATRYLTDLALTNSPEGENFVRQLQENVK